MATALPNGNLIVPVIKTAQEKNKTKKKTEDTKTKEKKDSAEKKTSSFLSKIKSLASKKTK